MSQTQKLLKIYIRIQSVLLCLVLGAFGACLAAQRTQYIAQGAPVSAQQEQALPQTVTQLVDRLPDKSRLHDLLPYLAALPAPAGCLAGTFFSLQEIWEQGVPILMDNLHKK